MNPNNAIVLKLHGLGHVPSKKNSKIPITVGKGRKRRTMIIIKPQTQLWIERAIRSIESQLISLCQTEENATWTADARRYAICSLLPADDCCQWVPEISLRAVNVPKGQEGAIIRVERIS